VKATVKKINLIVKKALKNSTVVEREAKQLNNNKKIIQIF
jgi:hypothetical protein